MTSEINAAGDETLYVYDGYGNVLQITDADGNVTSYSYNLKDLVESINYSDGKTVTYSYNKNGELVGMQDWTGTNTFALDQLGRITEAKGSKGRVTEYQYDEVGNQTQIKYPDLTVVDYQYDALNRLTAVKESENETKYAYDPAGRVKSIAYPNGKGEEYTYDAAGQLLKTVGFKTSDAKKIYDYNAKKEVLYKYDYDPQGNIISEYKRGLDGEKTAEETITYKYDALNRLTEAHEKIAQTDRYYTYDSLGNLISERTSTQANGDTNDNVKIDYKLNKLNQLVSKTVDKSNVFSYNYNELSDLTSKDKSSAYNNNYYGISGFDKETHEKYVYNYTYDKRGNLVKETYEKNVYGYAFDARGNTVRKTVETKNAVSGVYVYDATNRMVKGTNEDGETSSYTYNGLGALVNNTWEIKEDSHGYSGMLSPNPPAPKAEKYVPKSLPAGYYAQKFTTKTTNSIGKKTEDETSKAKPKMQTVSKDFVVDYTSSTYRNLMEYEYGGFDYRYVYGLDRISVNISQTKKIDVKVNGKTVQRTVETDISKLYVQTDRLGSTSYLTNPAGETVSYTGYDEWGVITGKMDFKIGKLHRMLTKTTPVTTTTRCSD